MLKGFAWAGKEAANHVVKHVWRKGRTPKLAPDTFIRNEVLLSKSVFTDKCNCGPPWPIMGLPIHEMTRMALIRVILLARMNTPRGGRKPPPPCRLERQRVFYA